MKCIHCGCTEERACIMLFVEQPFAIQASIERTHVQVGRPLPAPDDEMGCAWVSVAPPVCSNPSCVRKFEKSQPAAVPA